MCSTVQTKTRAASAGNEATKWKKHVGLKTGEKHLQKGHGLQPWGFTQLAVAVCVVAWIHPIVRRPLGFHVHLLVQWLH